MSQFGYKRVVTELVWEFMSQEAPHHLQIRLFKSTDLPWIEKITATADEGGDSHIRFDVELYNPKGIFDHTRREILETLEHYLGENDDMVGIELGEKFPAKQIAVIYLRKRAGVINTFRAFDGFVEIIKALTLNNISLMDVNGRPAPKVTQRTYVGNTSDARSYTPFGEWADEQYFRQHKQSGDNQNVLHRLQEAIGKQVKLRVMASNGGSEEKVGILGVLKGKGWILDGKTDKYWPLVSVDWVDVLGE